MERIMKSSIFNPRSSIFSRTNGQPFIDLLAQVLDRQSFGDQIVIYKNRGCGIDAPRVSALSVISHNGHYLKPIYISREAWNVQPYLAREIDQDRAEITHLAPHRLVF